MSLAISFFTHVPGTGHPQQAHADALQLFTLGEQLGYTTGWVAQHHFDRDYGRLPSPLPFLAYAAAETRQINLGTALVVLPFENGVRLAEDASVVDVLSGGRVQLGVGSGGDPTRSRELYPVFDADATDPVGQARHIAQRLRETLHGEPWHGDERLTLSHRFDDRERNLESRLWQGAQSPGAGAFIGAQGDGLLLARRALNTDEGTDVAQLRVVEAYLDALPEGVEPRIAVSRGLFINDFSDPEIDAETYWNHVIDRYSDGFVRSGRWPSGLSREEYEARSYIFRGTAHDIAERIEADPVLQHATELLIQVHAGATQRESVASLTSYAERLFPLLGADSGSPALVSPDDAAETIGRGALVFDVRSREVRERDGTLPGATPLDRNRLEAAFPGAAHGEHGEAGEEARQRDQPVVVYCSSERGSRPVAEWLRGHGFTNVSHIDGGFPAWKQHGLPVKPASPTADDVR